MESRISSIRSHLESVRQQLHRNVSPLSNNNTTTTTPLSVLLQTPNSLYRHRHRSSSSRRAISSTISTRSTNQRVHHAFPISSSPSTMSSSSHVSPRFDRHTFRNRFERYKTTISGEIKQDFLVKQKKMTPARDPKQMFSSCSERSAREGIWRILEEAS